MNGYNADDGFTGSIQMSKTKASVTGQLTKQFSDAADSLFEGDQQTGYYVPAKVTGTEGAVLKRIDTDKTQAIDNSDTTYAI